MLEILGAILGLIYIYLEFRASIHLWIVGAIMPVVYAIVYFQAELYAQGSIQLYYVAAALYGWGKWRNWKKRKQEGDPDEIPISRLNELGFQRCLYLAAFLSLPIFGVLKYFNESNVAYFDALISSFSIVAMLMLAMKVVEQWIMWFIVDVACVALYIYKDLHFTAALYALYAIVAIFGYRKWKQIMTAQNGE